MENLIITDDDIGYAEQILGFKKPFDNPRRVVIKSLESKDVVACPGSGKTTTLLAKLIILARRMPLEDNKGICVLTHTNVAIDEIKDKLGGEANALLSYPNFVGTIQSFIDKYLSIPASIKYYGIRPNRILEADEFEYRLIQCFRLMYPNFKKSKLQGLLYSKLNKEIKDKGWKIINCEKENILKNLRYDYLSNKILRNINGNETVFIKNVSTQSFEEYCSLINSLVEQGIISYNEANGLALRYSNELKDIIKPLFTSRFQYVFIDEMQDTSLIQNKILDNIFDKNKIVFQCFGDPNQAIYDGLDTDGVWKPDNPMIIKNSKRFSNSIAKVSDCIAIHPYNMQGCEEIDIPPIIFTYKDDVSSILKCFAKAIKNYGLKEEENSIFKAVGMVKNNANLCISNYYNSFNKSQNLNNINKDYSLLCEYLLKIDSNIVNKKGTKVYYNRFINAILKILRLSDCKTANNRYFSKSTFLRYLRDNHNDVYDYMNYFFIKCITKLEVNEYIVPKFSGFVNRLLKGVFEVSPNELVLEFMTAYSSDTAMASIESDDNGNNNLFQYDDINIQIDTVHGVKGESHTATLYLDTRFHEYCVSNIIKFLNGEGEKNTNARKRKHLKVAYVAMTRPKKLLGITMQEDIYENNKGKLSSMGWVKYNPEINKLG